MDGPIEILLYSAGGIAPFSRWLGALRDRRAVGVIRARLNRIRLGNFGDSKPVGGGVEELRIDFGPGYRVYFGRSGLVVVVLLCAGNKKTQSRDVRQAQKYWREFQDAQSRNKD